MRIHGLHPKISGSGGFTLIEVMIVTAVIAILASVALPGYNDYVRRSKLTDGTAVLADYRVKLEQYYQDNRNYGPVAGGACGAAPPTSAQTVSRAFSYACVVGAAPADTYIVTASNVAGAGLGAAADYVYTLNEQNARATTKFKGAASTATCWLIRSASC